MACFQSPGCGGLAQRTDDISKTLAFAHERGILVTTRGDGVGYIGGCVPSLGGIALSVRFLDSFLELNPDDGVAVVQPGVITGDLQDAARKTGWWRTTTIPKNKEVLRFTLKEIGIFVLPFFYV